MIADLTKHGLNFKRGQLILFLKSAPDFKQHVEDFIFKRMREPSYREYMSPFHTGSQDERFEKGVLREEELYARKLHTVSCPICGKQVTVLPWRDFYACSDCSLEVNRLYDSKGFKETFEFKERDRTQQILDIWNRSY